MTIYILLYKSNCQTDYDNILKWSALANYNVLFTNQGLSYLAVSCLMCILVLGSSWLGEKRTSTTPDIGLAVANIDIRDVNILLYDYLLSISSLSTLPAVFQGLLSIEPQPSRLLHSFPQLDVWCCLGILEMERTAVLKWLGESPEHL